LQIGEQRLHPWAFVEDAEELVVQRTAIESGRLEYFLCACILSNLLIGEPVPAHWEETLAADDELNVAVRRDAEGGERREQLLSYLIELRG
jgi:hypothetical protein